jgi:hypothetical protein
LDGWVGSEERPCLACGRVEFKFISRRAVILSADVEGLVDQDCLPPDTLRGVEMRCLDFTVWFFGIGYASQEGCFSR